MSKNNFVFFQWNFLNYALLILIVSGINMPKFLHIFKNSIFLCRIFEPFFVPKNPLLNPLLSLRRHNNKFFS